MTKKELLKYNPPHKMIIDLYEDNEEIPQEVIKTLYTKPAERKIVIYTNTKNEELWKAALEEEVSRLGLVVGISKSLLEND